MRNWTDVPNNPAKFTCSI